MYWRYRLIELVQTLPLSPAAASLRPLNACHQSGPSASVLEFLGRSTHREHRLARAAVSFYQWRDWLLPGAHAAPAWTRGSSTSRHRCAGIPAVRLSVLSLELRLHAACTCFRHNTTRCRRRSVTAGETPVTEYSGALWPMICPVSQRRTSRLSGFKDQGFFDRYCARH